MTNLLSPKKRLFEQFARVAKSLASANRLELLEALAQGEHGVDALSQASGMSVANTSHHLQILREGGLVQSRKEGLQVIYRLSGDDVLRLISAMRKVAELHLAEVDRIVRDNFEGKDNLTPIRRDELLDRVRDGEAMVIDVRPPSEYNAGHIDGAINIPLTSLADHLEKLPVEQEIVAYCRGPYCMLAFDAVAQLRQHGYRARRLEDGFPEWKAENLPTNSDTSP
ncbi:MAG: metalloregulator ArsR/SmtB family transcription factor [Sulfurimicrobium sp.]|jgi:rhodanese-related sulfurtransferase|nr:metalloregulator ArsR/SmtB family transcription factor [Sulfurimicrobium sp.]MDO9190379.1 metalloregulator ArsR/SmtB family transcription factor [Sulfurimicrobium sp.]MDP1705505.1 metalloregulator ArsR/SmtB family transcription factor [Sulfurimicrobium sp.]MDP1896907.1 metalloregulator ArsR/SmtB family transcription factor [Sulfurimicrobium sp.]MDP2198360.1 metalloregulator ArsR/SmtB family transcription factor [Sulfurimicrobium sp.]